MNGRQLMLAATLGAALAATCWLTRQAMTESRDDYLAACDDLRLCRQLAERITQLRDRPAMAADRQQLDVHTNLLVEQAAAGAGIPAENLLVIRHEPPRWIGDSSYKEQPVRLVLQKVTLRQAVALLHELACGQAALKPKSIRLSVPRGEDAGSEWSAEVVLTYLIYEVRRQP